MKTTAEDLVAGGELHTRGMGLHLGLEYHCYFKCGGTVRDSGHCNLEEHYKTKHKVEIISHNIKLSNMKERRFLTSSVVAFLTAWRLMKKVKTR